MEEICLKLSPVLETASDEFAQNSETVSGELSQILRKCGLCISAICNALGPDLSLFASISNTREQWVYVYVDLDPIKIIKLSAQF